MGHKRQAGRTGGIALALAMAFLAVPVALAQPAADAPARSADPSDLVERLLAVPDLSGDQQAAHLLDLFQVRGGPGLAAIYPPETVYKGVDAVCDLDGDGLGDLLSNEMQLRSNGRYDSGFSYIRALSGATGDQLWSADNLLYFNLGLQGAYGTQRAGLSNPQGPPNVASLPDVDGDGVCDVFAYGFDTRDFLTPFLLGTPSVTYYDVTVRVLSGKDGSIVWSSVVSAANADYSMPLLGFWTGNLIVGFPTGVALFDTPEGPRFVLKTTDLSYTYAEDFFGFTSIATGDPLYVANLVTAEHILFGNATDGSTVWKRDFGADAACLVQVSTPPAPDLACPGEAAPEPGDLPSAEPDNVNITWISGLGDLDADGTPDLVLDQLMLTNPRSSTVVDPISGDEMFRYGRGMRLMALDGRDGSDLWASTILDPLAVQPRPPNEENLEVLAWTFGRVLPDMDGDGRDEPFAQYLSEETVAGTPNGRHRTHFLLLDPASGAPLWDHPQQGWGHVAALSADRMAAGTLDLPGGIGGATRFPQKALRVAGLDAATGAAEWSYEERYGQDSQSSYELGLTQMRTALAPLDLDGDGTREVVTPSRTAPPEGPSQVFLATATQSFGVLDGRTGKVAKDLEAWGPSGLLLPCAEGDVLTFAVGHGRRMDLLRIDASTGDTVARRSIYTLTEERSPLVGVDLVSLDGRCSLTDGRLSYAVNLEAFSFFRRYEIVPMLGVLDADGAAVWRSPEMEEEPPTPSLLETRAEPPSLLASVPVFAAAVVLALGAGVALGVALGFPAGRALARRKRRLDPLGIALLLVVVPPAAVGIDDGMAAAGEPASDSSALAVAGLGRAADDAGPLPGSQEPAAQAAAAPGTDGDAPPDGQPTAIELVSDWSFRQLDALRGGLAAPDVSERFGENDTLTFPHVLGDLDGDGVDDLALDVYCSGNAYLACQDTSFASIYEPVAVAQEFMRPFVCGPYHRLVVVSGASGDRLWDDPLDEPIDMPGTVLNTQCAAEAVVGTVPLPEGGAGILLYRYEAIDPFEGIAGMVLNHTLMLRDGATGSAVWTFNEKGYRTPNALSMVSSNGAGVNPANQAISLLLNPMLVEPQAGRTPDRLGGAGLDLFVQGIGYRVAFADTVLAPPVMFDGPIRFTDEYLPVEWLARIDPATGEVQWRTDSFQPTPGRSVVPIPSKESLFRGSYRTAEERTPYDYPFDVPVAVTANAWGDALCCGDLSGDGVFDPAFLTLEWSPVPNANTGPQMLDSRAVAFDGATGARLWETVLVTDQPLQNQRTPYWQFPYDTLRQRMQAVGDANGDGAADVLLHQRVNHADFASAAVLLDGRTGAEAWRVELPKAQSALAVGDATGDGGNDLLFIDWFHLESYQEIRGDLSNSTRNPVRLRSGADGSLVYETATYNAPIDMMTIFANLARNGLPDLDADGVGDYPVDDPVFLPDQVILHQLEFISGRTGEGLYTVPVAGAFAFPVKLPDLDADGVSEVAMLSGDATDLWMGYHDGRSGKPLWGHRALALRTADFAVAVPKLEVLPMVTGFGEGDVGFLTNLHMDTEEVVGEYETYYIQVGGASGSERYIFTEATTVPQLTVVLDPEGSESWSYPSGGEIAGSRVDGASPGTAALLEIRSVAEPSTAALAVRALRDGWVPLATFGASLVASFLAIALTVRRKGVPA